MADAIGERVYGHEPEDYQSERVVTFFQNRPQAQSEEEEAPAPQPRKRPRPVASKRARAPVEPANGAAPPSAAPKLRSAEAGQRQRKAAPLAAAAEAAPTSKPDEPTLLEDLVEAAENEYIRYQGQLGLLSKGKQVLRLALESEEFTQQQMDTLVLGLHRQESALQPVLEQLSQQLKLAQRAWHRKSGLIKEAHDGGLLDDDTWRQWKETHERLADRIDVVVQKLTKPA